MNKQFGKQTGKQLREARAASETKQLGWETVDAIIQAAYEAQYEKDREGVFDPVHKPPKQRRLSVPRKRNEFIDTLADSCGGDAKQMTHSAIRTIAVAWAEIKQVSPECTCEEIRRRVSRYKSLHPTWPCTPGSIAKHWDSLGTSLGRTESARNDPYIAPPDWMDKASRLYPEADFTGREWSQIPITIRNSILQKS